MIKIRNLFFTFIIGCCLMLAGWISPLNTKSSSEKIVPGPFYSVFYDQTNEASIDSILAGQHQDDFHKSTQQHLGFGMTNETIWLHLSLQDVIDGPANGYILESVDKLDLVQVYFVKQDGSYTMQSGGVLGLHDQPFAYRSSFFPIEDPDATDLYISIEGLSFLSFTSYLYTETAFLEHISTHKFMTGLFYGFLLSLSLYNLFLFVSLKDKAYFYYVLYLVSFMLYQGTMNSFDLALFGQEWSSWLLFRNLPLASNLLALFMILFSKEFLDLKTHLPVYNRVLNGLLFVTILSLLSVYTVSDITIVNDVSILVVTVTAMFLWISGLRTLLKGFKMARFYMVGWTILLGSLLIQSFGFLGFIPFHPSLYETIPAVAASLEAIFLSLALGDKINLMKKDMNRQLEKQVWQRTKELEEAKKQLSMQLTETVSTLDETTKEVQRNELAFLQAQIKPHFLFNTLSSIISLCYTDNEKAGQLLTTLSNYLKRSFDVNTDTDFVTIENELKLVQAFVEIEQVRFGDRIKMTYQIDDEARQLQIPPLVIEPLVENAIRHGVLKNKQGGEVTVTIQKQRNCLYIAVKDNGKGIDPVQLTRIKKAEKGTPSAHGNGISLANIYTRLQTTYNVELHFDTNSTGTSVHFSIPVSEEI